MNPYCRPSDMLLIDTRYRLKRIHYFGCILLLSECDEHMRVSECVEMT